jgi:hypothetical protein
MSGFDADRIYSVSVHDVPNASSPESASETEKLLLDFLLQYRVGGEFIYRYACFWLVGSNTWIGIQRQTEGKSSFETILPWSRSSPCWFIQWWTRPCHSGSTDGRFASGTSIFWSSFSDVALTNQSIQVWKCCYQIRPHYLVPLCSVR